MGIKARQEMLGDPIVYRPRARQDASRAGPVQRLG
jgi:hypothetical protein